MRQKRTYCMLASICHCDSSSWFPLSLKAEVQRLEIHPGERWCSGLFSCGASEPVLGQGELNSIHRGRVCQLTVTRIAQIGAEEAHFCCSSSKLPEGGAPCSLLHVKLSSEHILSHGSHIPTRGQGSHPKLAAPKTPPATLSPNSCGC